MSTESSCIIYIDKSETPNIIRAIDVRNEESSEIISDSDASAIQAGSFSETRQIVVLK